MSKDKNDSDTPYFDGLATIPVLKDYAPEMHAARTGVTGEVIDGRVGVYGDPVATFPRIAEVWSGILGHPVSATDVPLMLAGMKLVRAQVTPDYSDNPDDVEGYIDIFRKVVGPDMIHARSVKEYLEKRDGRA